MTGCNTASNINQSMASAEDLGNSASNIVQVLQKKSSKSIVQFYPGQWVQKRPLVNPDSNPSPLLLCDFTYAISPQHAVTVFEVGQAIASACQIPVRMTPDAVDSLNGLQKSNNSKGSEITSSYGDLTHRPNHLKSKAVVITDLHWDGPVSGFLDTVTTRLGLSWKYEKNIILIYFLDTQRFFIKTLNAQGATKSVITSGISAQAGSKGIAGKTGSNQSSSVEINSDLYGDIKKIVESMLTPGIGRTELSHTTGVLSVTDTPEVLKKVEEYIHEENESLSKQVLLNVKIMSVEISEKNELGIDWGLVYRSLSQKYNVTLKNSFLASPEATAGAISILGNATQWAGSQVLIKALSEQGKTALLTTKSIVTTNMTPAPIQYAYQEGFLESQTVTRSKEAGSSTSLKPGYLTTGDNITLLPKLIPGTDDLMLDLIMSISSSKGFRTVKSSGDQGNIIELPRTEGQALYQRVWLKSGETLVLSGFEQDQKGGSQSGLGKSSHFLLGGGLSGKNRRTTLVITVTPVLI
jgi:type IVB pilus formation R64 PilN family outer membrane protein